MADDIQGLPPGATVTPMAPPTSSGVEGLPEGATITPLSKPASTENVQRGPAYDDPTKTEQPGLLSRAYETSGLKGIVEQAKASGAETDAVQKEAMDAIKNKNYGQAAETLLKHLITVHAQKPEWLQHGQQAIEDVKAGRTSDAVENSAEAVPVLGQIGESVGKPLGTDIGSKNYAGAAGDLAGVGAQLLVAHGAGKLAGMAGPAAAKGVEASAEDLAPKAQPLKAAGETVQKEAAATRDVAGKKVGAAKEAVVKSLPKNITPDAEYIKRVIEEKGKVPAKGFAQNPFEGKDFADLTPDQQATVTKEAQQLKTAETGQIPFPKKGNLSKAAQSVLKDVDNSQKLAGVKDPDMADLEQMAKHLSKGLDAQGEELSANPKEADSIKRAFDQKIDQLQTKADAGGNATALRHVKNLKTAFNDDLFDAYEQHGDPQAAQALRAANKEYAGIVGDQTSGPARAMFRNQSPEKIVSTIVNSGARSQSAVESLVRNMSKPGQETLRDSVLNEIYRKNALPDGTIDMVKARKNFYALGDTAKTLYGQDLKPVTDYLDAASKEQAARTAKATKGSLAKNIGTKVGKAAGAGVGAGVGSIAGTPGSIAGAVVGSEAADALFQNGKSGAVKIGISPTEKIVLSPSQAAASRPLITKFLKAKSAGNPTAIAAAYSALANQKPAQNQ